MINYIPNDPLTQSSLPIRQQPARPNRAANQAGFTLITPAPAENVFPQGTPEFLFWQSREAALATLEAWEAIDQPLTQWAPQVPNRRRLHLLPNQGQQLNAFYDGASISFFEHTAGGKTTFSGESADVVAHEAGHALLDTIRPDLWDTNFPETNAFHEAFGDCIALLTALSDQATRSALLQASPDLGSANFVEALAEDLSDGVRRYPRLGPQHSASAPRHALNNFRWTLPSTLPVQGPPSVLISEIHSFGRIFSGCFYDVVRNIFAGMAVKDEASLLNAAQMAGRILVTAARQAPETVRFFQSVGRAMVLADATLNAGANRDAIRAAFNGHNVALGTSAMLAARGALDGPAPKFSARAASILSADTVRDIKRRLDAPSAARLAVDILDIGAQKVARAVHMREVPLHQLAKELKGVVALVPDQLLVGNVEKSAAMLSSVPEPFTTQDEVFTFVKSLLEHDRLALDSKVAAAAVRSAIADPGTEYSPMPTHTIANRGGRKVLKRLRFACRADEIGCRWPAPK